MTIKHRQYFQNVSQQKKILVFECQKERLSEAAPEELLEQRGWRKKQWNATVHQWDATVHANGSQPAELSPQGCELRRQIEDERVCHSEEGLLVEGKLKEGGNNRLMILANSAELMSEYEDSLRTVHLNPLDHEALDSTTGAQHLQENVNDVTATDCDKNWDKVDEMPPIAHGRIEKDGSHCEGTVTRLSQIFYQARLRSQPVLQKSIQEDTNRCLIGSKTRLTQIRRQARSGNHVSVQKDIAGFSHGKLLGGITRLSQIRRQARFRSNWSLQEGTREHMNSQLDCQFHEDHQKEGAATEQKIGAASSSCSDTENMDKIMCEKGRLRLRKLRCKVRLENADLVAQRNARILHNCNKN